LASKKLWYSQEVQTRQPLASAVRDSILQAKAAEPDAGGPDPAHHFSANRTASGSSGAMPFIQQPKLIAGRIFECIDGAHTGAQRVVIHCDVALSELLNSRPQVINAKDGQNDIEPGVCHQQDHRSASHTQSDYSGSGIVLEGPFGSKNIPVKLSINI
jgi:hypothetical protein